jgi:hypothetical protein
MACLTCRYSQGASRPEKGLEAHSTSAAKPLKTPRNSRREVKDASKAYTTHRRRCSEASHTHFWNMRPSTGTNLDRHTHINSQSIHHTTMKCKQRAGHSGGQPQDLSINADSNPSEPRPYDTCPPSTHNLAYWHSSHAQTTHTRL